MSCVNQVYESDNANFQASVSLPSNVLNGGNFVGGYDAILNKVIFAYENPCIDPSAVEIITSNWSSSYVSNKNKTALDDNCAGTSTSTPVLAYNRTSSYFSISDYMINEMIFQNVAEGGSIIICCGECKTTVDSVIKTGFIFMFNVVTGEPYTPALSNPDIFSGGWYIRGDAGYDTVINSVSCSGKDSFFLIAGGYTKNSSGEKQQRLVLLPSVDGTSTTTIPDNDFSPETVSDVDVVGINYINSTTYCIIYQITTANTSAVIMRCISIDVGNAGTFTSTWLNENLTITLPPNFHGNYLYATFYQSHSQIELLPPSEFATGYSAGNNIFFITFQYTQVNPTPNYETIMILPINVDEGNNFMLEYAGQNSGGSGDFNTVWIFTNPDVPSNNNGLSPLSSGYNGLSGILVLDPTVYKNMYSINTCKYYSQSQLSAYLIKPIPFVDDSTGYIFMEGSYNNGEKFVTFIKVNVNSPTTNKPSSYMLDYIFNSDSKSSDIQLDKINGSDGTTTALKVSLDHNLPGSLNDLYFELKLCPSSLHLFAFGNYQINPTSASVSSGILLNAISNICLSKGTQILCDQGIINIEKINTRKHTINNKPINHITQSIHTDDYLIKIKKNCLSSNIPSSDIICSGDHKILYENNLIESKNLINKVYGVEKIKNDKRVLYNILMDKYEIIMANNTPVESLHPQNIMALFYNNYNNPQAREFLSDKIGQMNNHNIHVNKINKNKLNGLMVGNKISKKMSLKITNQ